jgi:hypothetical protein
MGNSTDKKQDCGCEGNCNPKKPRSRWIKYISVLILMGALAIVIVKITQDKKPPAGQCVSAPGKSCCGDSTGKADTAKQSPCCSKSGK